MTGDAPLIDVAGLRQSFLTRSGARVEALRSVSFSVRQGEFVAFLGPSGCGKTSLLKTIAGLNRHGRKSVILGGEVRRGGEAVAGPSRDIGMVFQSPVLLAWRTVLQNVLLPVEIYGLDQAVHRERARALLAVVGLAGFEDRLPRELSGGMQQRVAIVRALITDPRMLLMDEPFGALDAMTRERLNEELLRIWEGSAKTVLFVTHAIEEAVFLADRILVFSARPGRLVADLAVGLRRPRDIAMLGLPQSAALVAAIRGHLGAVQLP